MMVLYISFGIITCALFYLNMINYDLWIQSVSRILMMTAISLFVSVTGLSNMHKQNQVLLLEHDHRFRYAWLLNLGLFICCLDAYSIKIMPKISFVVFHVLLLIFIGVKIYENTILWNEIQRLSSCKSNPFGPKGQSRHLPVTGQQVAVWAQLCVNCVGVAGAVTWGWSTAEQKVYGDNHNTLPAQVASHVATGCSTDDVELNNRVQDQRRLLANDSRVKTDYFFEHYVPHITQEAQSLNNIKKNLLLEDDDLLHKAILNEAFPKPSKNVLLPVEHKQD